MAKKQFKAESKRLLDLMINSIYTNREIFLRELLSNASDAVDKLSYKALTDDKIGIKRKDFQITIVPDRENRTLTISDNGIGMTKEELEQNLGTIAKSGSLQFKQEMDKAEKGAKNIDIIGQFGVGFYSAFMVADKVTVRSKAYGADESWQWESNGADGYTVEPCDKASLGTEVILHLKPDTEEDNYSEFLEPYRIQGLVKKYSDYVHTPIRMEMEHSKMKDKPADAGEDYQPEYETVREWETLNSMVPLWQRQKSKVKKEEYDQFYREKFGDWEEPLAVIHTAAEGQMEYKAMLFIPAHAPYDYYSKDYEKGLQLYSSGVLIMDKCPEVVPDHFSFVKGVVDSADLPLNISRETLQHTRALHIIENNVEKKVKAELLKLQKEDREKYLKFWKGFARQLKYGTVNGYGAKKEVLQDLLLFPSSNGEELTTLSEYVERMKEGQESIFYLCAENVEMAKALPQAERVLDKGYEILYFTDEVDEFVAQTLMQYMDKPFKDAASADALPESEEEKADAEKKAEANKPVLDFVKEALGDKVFDVRISKVLKSGAVCLTTDGPMSLEMEKYFQRVEGGMAGMKAQRVLELNADSPVYGALARAVAQEPEKARKYAELLYDQALIIAGIPVEDTAEYTKLVCELMV
ncbi:MAG: molecular chaperone HtpG [Oscillospiraceae bacterium]|nr:molecular chaperone HtpG [Oscillospiraceae bacterium]